MNNIYIAIFWRSNLQLKNGGYYTTREFKATSFSAAKKQAERYAKSVIYGGLELIKISKHLTLF